jgi:uncharacterized protein (DUF736 family)
MGKITIPLFKNKTKKNDKQPDYRFSYQDENGEWHAVAVAWKNESKNGEVYLTVQISQEEYDLYEKNKKPFNNEKVVDEEVVDSIEEELPF